MAPDFTLPRLQGMLDGLSDGERLALAGKQVDELFGLNDVRSARLAHFASGHSCIILHEDDCVVFEKRKADPAVSA